jgi:hypothetical protein
MIACNTSGQELDRLEEKNRNFINPDSIRTQTGNVWAYAMGRAVDDLRRGR